MRCVLFLLALFTQSTDLKDQTRVGVTVYNSQLALVKDVRKLRLGRGVQSLKFMGVASQINPTTVHIKSLSNAAALAVLEQNYEYDLLSPQRLMEKYVGQEVTLVETNPKTGEKAETKATLLSVSGGTVFKTKDGIITNAFGQVRFPNLPGELLSQPTLVWLLKNDQEGEQTVEASYLTGGISWKADYVAVLDKEDKKADLSGWVTLDNQSGATYADASLQLVAGDVHRVQEEFETMRGVMPMAARADAMGKGFQEESFFEYHLYSLDRPATIKERQTKQISLFSAGDVSIAKELVYYGAAHYFRSQYGTPISNQKIGVYIRLKNSKANRLGIPLPKGIVRVYKADSQERLQFIGEDRIDHTPKDEEVRIKMGEAFDVVGERRQTEYKSIAWNVYEVGWEIKLRNHKDDDVTVKVIEPIAWDWEMLSSTHKHVKEDAHTFSFAVRVPKNKEEIVRYRVRVKW